MAKLVLDLTGAKGLTTKYAGDVHDSSSQPHLRYTATEGEMVSGIYNPFKKYGYLSPTSNVKEDLTGTLTSLVTTAEYDSVNDLIYIAESTKIHTINGADGLTITNLKSYSTNTPNDLEIYQMYDTRVLSMTIDSNDDHYYNLQAGFLPLDLNSGGYYLHSNPVEQEIAYQYDMQTAQDVKMAQKIYKYDTYSTTVRKIRLRMAQAITSGINYNFKVTLQNDSAGSPDGTALATYTASTSTLKGINRDGDDVFIDFGSSISVANDFWIVIEPVTVGDLSNGGLYVYGTNGGTTLYSGGTAKRYNAGSWQVLDGSATISLDFSVLDESSTWWNRVSTGVANDIDDINNGTTNFMQKADNGMCYWFTGNAVHKLDGSLAGGIIGSITRDVLVFPSSMVCMDAVDTNGLMYIGVQTSPRSGATTTRAFNGDVCGVYVWDRLSTVVRTRDFIPLPGAREIRKVFQTREGDVRAITINNDRKVEIRVLTNSAFKVTYELDESAYPPYRDSLSYMNNHVIWMGVDGLIYALGKTSPSDAEGLYIIGDMTTFSTGAFTAGIIVPVNEPASGNQQAVYVSFLDGSTSKMIKWYPHGVGTINSVAQKANQGNVYTGVKYLPLLSDVKDMVIYCAPGTNTTTDTVATVKLYFNQSATAGMTKTITKKDVSRGYIHIDIGKSFINAIQAEIEWDTSLTMGTDDFTPTMAIINYTATDTHSPSAN